jgi:hypothetical protein
MTLQRADSFPKLARNHNGSARLCRAAAEGIPMADEAPTGIEEEEFQPRGTVAILAMFVLAIIILWGSVYLILLSRGVTV